MNKHEFVKEIAKRSGVSEYAVSEIYHVSYELIAETLIQEERVELPKIGVFTIHTKNAKNLFGAPKDTAGICSYPSFRICEGLKGRIKNGCKISKKLCRNEENNETKLF